MNPLSAAAQQGLFYAALILGSALLVSNVAWYGVYQRKVDQYETALIAKGSADAAFASTVASNTIIDAQLRNETAKLLTCHGELRQQTLDTAAAKALLQAKLAPIEAELASWSARWAQLSSSCNVALANAQHACVDDIPVY
jgi:hypothetical protein